MAAGIESDDYMFSGNDVMPWHGTNVTVVKGLLTAEEALREAKLDWEALLESMKLTEDNSPVPRFYAVVRQSDRKVLGVVKKRFRVLQNAEAFAFADAIVGGGGSMYETAGSLYGGRQVYLTLKTPFSVELPGGDRLDTWLLVANRHDGSGSITVAIITIRVVCANTLSRSIAGAAALVKIRHTATMAAKMAEAGRVLGLAQGAANRAEDIATKLLKQRMGNDKFERFLDLLLDPGVDSNRELNKRAITMAEQKRELITDIYATHPTQDAIRGTAWGALNAVTYYNDHMVRRNTMSDGDGTPADQRMQSILAGNNISDKALAILSDGLGGGRWLSGRSK